MNSHAAIMRWTRRTNRVENGIMNICIENCVKEDDNMATTMELVEQERAAYLKKLEDYLAELESMPLEELRRKALQNLVASKILKEDGSFTETYTCGKMEKEPMIENIESVRPCSISDSIMQSCKEVKEMRNGRMPKPSLDNLLSKIQRMEMDFKRESSYIENILDEIIEEINKAIKEDYNNFVENAFREIGFSLSELSDDRYEKERQITILDGTAEMHEFFINGECVLKFKRTIIHDGLDMIRVIYESI